MNAAPEDQLKLLDVQELDSTLDRLEHRRATLPEHDEIASLEARRTAVSDDVVRAETEDSDLGREQAKVDVDVEQVRSRMSRDQQRLDSGQVSSPKELENLQSEIESLHRRQTELEDAELEVMEQRETVQARLAGLRGELATIEQGLADASSRRDAALAEIAAEVEKTTAHRGETAAGVPGDLLELYTKLRQSSGGVGAAALRRGQCEGCHLQLNTTDINRIRDAEPDEVLRCEECRRILVRTADSGL
ncbi:MAG TPA: C4-type zinc ribbon domain-containing protein [Mycobacteriales bacterium]|nr:C4-type zinc ribbon domain-containing protein [Mycobacteriales bacterium]